MNSPLMPKATAIWLVQNTKLTFTQIADFCHLHPLEVQNLADDGAILPFDPVASGQVSMEEIHRCESNPETRINMSQVVTIQPKRKARYVPIAKRADRPSAIAWMVRKYSFIPNKEIMRLLGTTAKMVQSIRDESYPDMAQLVPQSPVLLGLCTMEELNQIIIRSQPEEK